MKKEFNLQLWVNECVAKLKNEMRKSKIKDRLWVTIFLAVNVITICAAVIALAFLFLYDSEKKINLTGNISLIFTIISLVFIILTFILQIFNKIYASHMRDQIYLVSINKLKLEIVRYENRIGKYNDENREKNLLNFVNSVQQDVLTFQKTKISLRQAFVATAIRSK